MPIIDWIIYGDLKLDPICRSVTRDECLNVNWFMSLEDAKNKIENWRQDYNYLRPHSSLSDTPPALFAKQFENVNIAEFSD